MKNSQRISHTHLQFATANSTSQNCKRVCLAYANNVNANINKIVLKHFRANASLDICKKLFKYIVTMSFRVF